MASVSRVSSIPSIEKLRFHSITLEDPFEEHRFRFGSFSRKVMKRNEGSISKSMKEDAFRRSKLALRRFRRAVRFVIRNARWMETFADERIERYLKSSKKQKHIFTKEVKTFFNTDPEMRTREQLSRAKVVFYLTMLKCFRAYDKPTVERLAMRLRLQNLGPGRTVVKEGRSGLFMYFIITGTLKVLKLEFVSKATGFENVERMDLQSGDEFGAAALLTQTGREASVITRTYCELLVLDKEDYLEILLPVKLNIRKQTEYVLNTFPVFKHLHIADQKELLIMSQVKEFTRGELIVRDDTLSGQMMAYFLIRGKCSLIEHLDIYKADEDSEWELAVPRAHIRDWYSSLMFSKSRSTSRQTSSHRTVSVSMQKFAYLQRKKSTRFNVSVPLASLQPSHTKNLRSHKYSTLTDKLEDITVFNAMKSDKNRVCAYRARKWSDILAEAYDELLFQYRIAGYVPPSEVKTKFVRIAEYIAGGYFFVGENTENRYVVADDDCTLVLIPKYLLRNKYENHWNIIANKINRTLPSRQEVLDRIMDVRKWKVWANDMTKNMKRKKTFNQQENIPFWVRINSLNPEGL